jgi:autotransporter-associated beta strand protein
LIASLGAGAVWTGSDRAAIANLVLAGTGNFTLTGTAESNVTVGQLVIDGGTLNSANWGNFITPTAFTYDTTQDITLNSGGATVDLGLTAGKTLARNLVGAGSLTKTGAGTLTLTGTNAHAGMAVTGGLVCFAKDANLGTGNITLDGGGLQWAAGSTLDISGRLNPLGAGGGIFDTNGNNVTLSGAISGSGALTKTGAGTLTLTGNNTYTGLTEVREGALTLSGAGTISPLLSLYGGTTFTGSPTNLTQLDVRGPATWTGNLNMSGQSMNFYLPAGLANNGTMLTVTGTAEIADAMVALDPAGGATWANGNTYTLITATALNTPAGAFPVNGTVGGFSYTVSVVGNTLVLNINALSSNHSIPTLGHWALLLLIAILGMGAAFHPSVRSQMARNKS